MKATFLILVPLLIVSLLFSSACAKEVVPKESRTKGEIAVGIFDDLSGPGAGLSSDYVEGYQDALRYFNEEKGGISGHPLEAIVADHKMDATLAVSGWDRLKNEDVLAILSSQAGIVPIITQAADRDKLPLVTGAGTVGQMYPAGPSYLFFTGTFLYSYVEAECDMIEEDWAKTGEKRPPKVAFDVMSFGNYRQLFSKASRMEAEKRGWDYLITYTPLVVADVTTQALQVKNFGPDYLHLHVGDASCIAWLKELDRQNLHPKISGHCHLGAGSVWRAVGPLCAGSKILMFGPVWTDTDIPGVSLLHELNSKWYPQISYRTGNYIRGYSIALAAIEGMRRAVDNVEFEKLDREAVVTALDSIKDYDPIEMGMGYSWSATERDGLRGCIFYEWTENGDQIPATGWYTGRSLPQEWRTDAFWLSD